MSRLRVSLLPATVLAAAVLLSACQGVPFPSPTPSALGDGSGGTGATDVDVSEVTGDPPAEGLVDPCSLLTVDEIEAATGVAVLGVVRGAVKSDGSQLCAYAMDAEGSTHSALAGTPLLPDDGGIGSVVNGLKAGSAAVGVLLSEQDPDTDLGAGDEGDGDGEGQPPGVTIQQLSLGKGAFVAATPNGGAAIAANPQNVLLTIMDLIAGPADPSALASLLTAAYGRLES